MHAQSLSLPSRAAVLMQRALAALCVVVTMVAALAAAEQPRVLYLYGDVAADGTIPSEAQAPFHQMRLNDTGDRGMTQFRDAIIEAGFAIEERYDAATTLTTTFLASYKVVILGSNQKRFSAAEAAAVNTWVNGGGGLIAYSDSAFGGAYQQVGIGNTKGRDSDNDLTVQFGMYFMRDNGAGNYLINHYEFDHFINGQNQNGGLGFRGEGVSPVRVSAPAVMVAKLQNGGLGGGIRLHPDDPPYNAAIDAALAIARVGNGRVLGTFDRNTFWNAGEGTRLSHVDNRLFAQRIVLWAAGLDGAPPAPNQPPAVELTAPETSAIFTAPATVTMFATASDSDGTITKVEFFANGTKVGEDTTSPYGFSWTNVAAGSYSLTARAIDDDGAATTFSAVAITVDSAPPPTQAPFNGTPAPVPGRIQAEHYDLGGAGVAYHDTTSGNSGGALRSDAVDIQATSDTGGGHNVGWIATGEWLEYTVQVSTAGIYNLQARVAAPSTGGQFRITYLGLDKTGPVVVPATGGWQNWTTVSIGGVSLPAGTLVLRLEVLGGNWNLNWFELAASAAPISLEAGPNQQLTLPYNTVTLGATVSGGSGPAELTWSQLSGPSSGQVYRLGDGPEWQLLVEEAGVYQLQAVASDGLTSVSDVLTVFVNPFPAALPGRFEAEDANLGNGLGYVDTTPGNSGGQYRNDDLDVEICSDVGGGFNVGWMAAGERLDWSTLSQAGFYDVRVRVASAHSGPKSFRLFINDRDVSGLVTFNTGGAGWQSWQDVVIANVESYGYFETVRLVSESDQWNLNYLEFTPVDPDGGEPPPVPAAVALNAGGGASGDFAADAQVSGGKTYATSAPIDTAGVNNPAPLAVYQTERYGNFTYTIGNLTPGASYTLRLHFAEIYWTSAGNRVFHVAINGAAQLTNFDIYTAAGARYRAVVREFTVNANGSGQLVVGFTSITDNAKLSGLEVIAAIPTGNG